MKQVDVLNTFNYKCRVIYKYYRVRIVRLTPIHREGDRVEIKDLDIFFNAIESCMDDMDNHAIALLNTNPQLQDQLDGIMYKYISKFNAIALLLRNRLRSGYSSKKS